MFVWEKRIKYLAIRIIEEMRGDKSNDVMKILVDFLIFHIQYL